MQQTTDDFLKRADVRIDRVFDAPPARVYEAWTDPGQMALWMWAGLGTDAWAEANVRVGGVYRVYTKFPGGRHQGEGWSGMAGVYLTVAPDRSLVYTLHWDADVEYNRGDRLAPDEAVTLTLTPDGDRTRMTYVHHGIPDDGKSPATHRAGTEQAFDLLAKLLAG